MELIKTKNIVIIYLEIKYNLEREVLKYILIQMLPKMFELFSIGN